MRLRVDVIFVEGRGFRGEYYRWNVCLQYYPTQVRKPVPCKGIDSAWEVQLHGCRLREEPILCKGDCMFCSSMTGERGEGREVLRGCVEVHGWRNRFCWCWNRLCDFVELENRFWWC